MMMMMMMMVCLLTIATHLLSNVSGRDQVIVNLRRELPLTNSFDAVAAETKLVR